MNAKATLLLFLLACITLRADDLVTRDGKVYRDYQVVGHDDGYLTILYADGGGKIPLAELNDAMRKQYGYDPAKAATVVAATDAETKANQVRINQQLSAQEAPKKPAQPVPAFVVAPPPSMKHSASNPKIDVGANEMQIVQDKEDLDSAQQDLVVAQRDADRDNHVGYPYYWWDAHYDNTGTWHPNASFGAATSEVPQLKDKIAKLTAEIAELEKQDDSVAEK